MKMSMKLLAVAAVVIVVAASLGYVLLAQGNQKKTLMLATTTSTDDSGLLDYILPVFEKKYDCKVDVIAVGSGQALELGKRGDVDVLLVHSPAAEIQFMADGFGESRTLVMYNNFVIVGPTGDPAGTSTSHNVSEAFMKIHDNGTAGLVKFLSRADNSGTNTKELAIWKNAGYNVSTFATSWYQKTGQAMGALLDMTEQGTASYTLSDDATCYQRMSENLIPHLNITYAGDPGLFNQYSVIPVNSTMWPNVNHTLALSFKEWLTSTDGQDLIASYAKYGHQLFFPNAPAQSATASVRELGLGEVSLHSSFESVYRAKDQNLQLPW
jgi:tungstate transport system substrate-binding protein